MSASFSSLEVVSSSFEEAYRAGGSSAVAFDRGHRATLEVTGKDRETFLQNMLSGDLNSLLPGRGRLATFLTNKGKLVADFIVLRDEERFFLDVESERAEALLAALDRYIISEDVALARVKDEKRFSIEGPDAAERIESLLQSEAPLESLPHHGLAWGYRGNERARILAYRFDPSPRYDVAARSELASSLLDELLRRGVVPGTEAVRETRRIEAGRGRFGLDFDDSHMPLEAGLDEAVSFDKGCYIGQEYVVRLAHRGHLNRKLSGITLEGTEPPAPGTAITSKEDVPQEVGHVTSAAYSPTLGKVIALAWLKRGSLEPGTPLHARGMDGIVTALPFVSPPAS